MSWNEIALSDAAKRTSNPIRNIVDNLKIVPNAEKEFISLALGDPTVFGNFPPPENSTAEILKQLTAQKSNGYAPSIGYEFAREAIAKKHSTANRPLTSSDVIITSGCSGALDICISALANPGQNVLIPRPAFSLYQTLCDSKGIEVRHYDLDPSRNWEIDLVHLASLVDSKTTCILINNPSNPCGSVYSERHLKELLVVAERFKLPIIADEIYADMAFKPFKFIPLSELTHTVPVLSVGGLAKKYLVPGWRVGWIIIHDSQNLFKQVRKGLGALSALILGSNSLIQSIIPELLLNTPESFYESTMKQLEENATLSKAMISRIAGLDVVVPQGAMYMMVGIKKGAFKDIVDDLDFTQKLVSEESVLCLPGQCFKFPNYFRVVITAPQDKLEIAFERMAEFCARYAK